MDMKRSYLIRLVIEHDILVYQPVDVKLDVLHFAPSHKFQDLQQNHETLINTGAPEGTRTPNLQIRSLALYPIELRVHKKCVQGSIPSIRDNKQYLVKPQVFFLTFFP